MRQIVLLTEICATPMPILILYITFEIIFYYFKISKIEGSYSETAQMDVILIQFNLIYRVSFLNYGRIHKKTNNPLFILIIVIGVEVDFVFTTRLTNQICIKFSMLKLNFNDYNFLFKEIIGKLNYP